VAHGPVAQLGCEDSLVVGFGLSDGAFDGKDTPVGPLFFHLEPATKDAGVPGL
jgi:hypothetical protein